MSLGNLATASYQRGFDLDETATVDKVANVPVRVENDPDFGTQSPKVTKLATPARIAGGPKQPNIVFLPLQEWEGSVTSIAEDSFSAKLVNLSDPKSGFQDEAEFPLTDLSDDAKSLLKEGAIFRWSIGYLTIDGSRQKTSNILFRRLPVWSERELKNAQIRATELSNAICWE